jgi:predicted phosphodiesterase
LHALYEHTAPATLERLGEENLRWLRALPHEFRHEDIALVHASPADLWRAPLPADDDEAFRTAYGPLGAGYVVYGHIHRPFVRVVDNMTVANSGSAGHTWDGDPRASYLLVDDGHLEIRRLEYPIDRDIDDLLATAYPYAEWLAAMRRSGSYVQPPAV